ncbi:MAG TPA: aldehyde dehydrogenase family protein [Longimicrobiales bacterium]|nr:aldehyde dehydrogenase family protein [Longimicrobiales bacterium]
MSEGRPSFIEVRSPAHDRVLGRVPNLDPAAVADLVRRSRAAQPRWAARPVEERAALLQAFRRRLADRAEEAARLSAAESGKLEFEGLVGDVLPCLDLARFYARRVRAVMRPQRVRSWMVTKKALVEREPFGVVGIISPWNFPVVNPMRGVMAALVTGNTVVLKPSELSPLSALLMEEIARDAGFPPDVFLVATGDGRAGAALVAARVDKISFTGSVAVGREVARAAASLLIPVVLELAGKNAMIVLADASLERAVNLGIQGAYWNAGQICIATERVYVEDGIYDAFVARVVAATGSLVVANRDQPDADIGALTTQAQVARLDRQIADARAKGARVLSGGALLPGPGRHFAPTVVADVDHSMVIMREESFGPVMPIMRVRDADEAIRLANDSPFALAASIWTRRRRGERLVRRLRAGMVSVNDVLHHGAVAGLPFGGRGDSGYGRVHGEEGLREMTQTRSILVDRAGARREPVGGFPFRRFGTRRAAALVRFLHGTGPRDRVRGLLGILRNR